MLFANININYRLRALVAKRDWNEIEEISKARKSPIGWEVCLPYPFSFSESFTQPHRHTARYRNKLTSPETNKQPYFNLVLQAGNPRLASVFIPKCTNLKDVTTIVMYEKCGMRIKAAEEAVRLKNRDEWARLIEAAGKNTTEGREIERVGAAAFKRGV